MYHVTYQTKELVMKNKNVFFFIILNLVKKILNKIMWKTIIWGPISQSKKV